ncbi:hypothetical protein [Streptomyces sp. NPDC048637]|uniref:hypothetical protein n=1 Tax=Streptomyces sp. NPDC048637 TaxID=3155636 RepID=UPI003436107C
MQLALDGPEPAGFLAGAQTQLLGEQGQLGGSAPRPPPGGGLFVAVEEMGVAPHHHGRVGHGQLLTVRSLCGFASNVAPHLLAEGLVAVRVAGRLEVAAGQVGYWPAHDAGRDASAEQVAGTLGLDEEGARMLMARFGGWSPYR